ncbi:MAG TPA: FAD-dependent monooxygenase, partial [Puia sp.]|nr:FAD-dependent monooxygenase [Puia sp.]
MKTVIIGGGIAGMAMGTFLERRGIETVICEKLTGIAERGHAFLMHAEAIAILGELDGNRHSGLPGGEVKAFQLFRPDGQFVKKASLAGWRCMKRCTLTAYLESLLPAGTIKGGRVFSHFIRERGKVVAAAFTNGETEYGDLFIGADGGNSKVRQALFGEVRMSEIAVKEVVGMTMNGTLARRYAGTFIKYQEADCGLAFGMIPTGDEEIVWFMQYDPSMGDVAEHDPAALAQFCQMMLANFPAEVQVILRGNDFSKSYIWHTRDFDLLPAF